ncbi:sigma-70 family RNA polymerase sigma factor [Leifsonia sp. NPDC056665]|uniref:sigma-70 family RNA polymerase sigma factor n=1 Tax=Leifsonia sp. NPDC056665 TaxID=3345901 RepID=UPI0036B4A5E1
MTRLAARKDAIDALSDSQLVDRTRGGDQRAYAELWQRHYRAGVTVARSYTTAFDPDDLVSEAFTRMFAAIADGGGPTSGFRPYLFTVIRNTAASWGRRAAHEIAIEHAEEIEDLRFTEANRLDELDRSLAATAFRALPPRWQEVLWHTEVEGLPPREVAPLLGMSANSVAALAVRAREGLRTAWIQAHLATVPEGSEHHWAIEHLGIGLRKRLAASVQRRLDAHLEECADCRVAAVEAAEANRHIGFVLLPLAAGVGGAVAYASGAREGEAAPASAAEPATGVGWRAWGPRGVVAGAAVVAATSIVATSIVAVSLGVAPRETVSAPVADLARPSATAAPGVPAVGSEGRPAPAPTPVAPPASVPEPVPHPTADHSADGATAAQAAPGAVLAPTAPPTQAPMSTPTPIPHPTPSPTPSPTPNPTSTPTPVPTPTSTPTPTPIPTPTAPSPPAGRAPAHTHTHGHGQRTHRTGSVTPRGEIAP